MARKIQFRRGTAASWTRTDPTLAIGELGLETDTGKIKIGDGVTAWSSQPYIDAGAVAHLADTSAAHAASAVSFTPASGVAASDVQAAIVEVATDVTDHLADTTAAHAASAISFTPAGTIAATTVQAAIAELDSEASSRFLPLSGSATGVASDLTQASYGVDVSTKGGWAAVKMTGSSASTANKAPLQLYSPKASPTGEDVLLTVDFAGNGFPGPITAIKADGGISTGAYLIVSGHAKNGGASSLYAEATYKRTMVTVWTDTPGASASESNVVLSLRNLGATYPSGDGGNCDVLLIVEDDTAGVQANGKERLSIRPKGDIYQMFTTHTTDWANATNYERAHLGWDVANNRYVVETQAGGTGTRRELLVKDRKFVTATIPGSHSAAGLTNPLIWPVPRACVIKSVKFSSLTSLSISATDYWNIGVTKYSGGAYVGDIIVKGNSTIALSSATSNDLGTPSATHGVLAAGDVVRVYINKVAGAPAALDCPTVVIEWEPT